MSEWWFGGRWPPCWAQTPWNIWGIPRRRFGSRAGGRWRSWVTHRCSGPLSTPGPRWRGELINQRTLPGRGRYGRQLLSVPASGDPQALTHLVHTHAHTHVHKPTRTDPLFQVKKTNLNSLKLDITSVCVCSVCVCMWGCVCACRRVFVCSNLFTCSMLLNFTNRSNNYGIHSLQVKGELLSIPPEELQTVYHCSWATQGRWKNLMVTCHLVLGKGDLITYQTAFNVNRLNRFHKCASNHFWLLPLPKGRKINFNLKSSIRSICMFQRSVLHIILGNKYGCQAEEKNIIEVVVCHCLVRHFLALLSQSCVILYCQHS